MSAASMAGAGVGLLVGVAAGVILAPMRGSEMRSSLRSRADHAIDRAMRIIDEGRLALRTSSAAPATPLTATLGEIAQMHTGTPLPSEARS